MALYSDRASSDPAMREFDDDMARINRREVEDRAAMPDGSWSLLSLASTEIATETERAIAEAEAKRDANLVARGLRMVRTQLDDGAYWIDIQATAS